MLPANHDYRVCAATTPAVLPATPQVQPPQYVAPQVQCWFIDSVRVPFFKKGSLNFENFPPDKIPKYTFDSSNPQYQIALIAFDVRVSRIRKMFRRCVPENLTTPKLIVSFARVMERVLHRYIPRAALRKLTSTMWWLEQSYDAIEHALVDHHICAQINNVIYEFHI